MDKDDDGYFTEIARDDAAINDLIAGQNLDARGRLWRWLREWREEIMADEKTDKPRGYDPTGAAGRRSALEAALTLTRSDPRFSDDIGAILDLAEYLRSGRRGLPLVDCDDTGG